MSDSNDCYLTDFYTWWLDHEDRYFRYLVYRRSYTPYEQEEKFVDESFFENDSGYSFGWIKEAVELPDGDILLGIKTYFSDDEAEYIEYYKLSEIRLSYCSLDSPPDLESDE